jgi:hypothetical protein
MGWTIKRRSAALALALLAVWMAMPGRAFALTGGTNITIQDGTVSVSGTVSVTLGGTGAGSFTANGVLLGNGTSAFQVSAAGTAGQPFLSGGSGAAGAYAALDISTAAVTGTLPVARGGTNLTASPDDNVMVGNGTTWQSKAIGDCDGAQNALTYDVTTNAFACNTISGGTTINGAQGFGSGMNLSPGSLTYYFGLGTGLDQAEAVVEVPLPALTLANLRCRSSAAPGGSGITVTARVGTCGALSDNTTLQVVLTVAGTVVADSVGTINVTANQCATFSAVAASTTTATRVGCSVERTA